jgi:hypothetical protein
VLVIPDPYAIAIVFSTAVASSNRYVKASPAAGCGWTMVGRFCVLELGDCRKLCEGILHDIARPVHLIARDRIKQLSEPIRT